MLSSTPTRQRKTKTKQVKEYDSRFPLFQGFWKRSIVGVDEDIAMDNMDEPHIKRKQVILEKHPEITSLYGPEPLTKWVIMFNTVVQLSLAYYFGRVNTEATWLYAGVAYAIGGTCIQVLGLLIHEAAHDLLFKTPIYNRLGGFLANVTIPFPIAASFRRYHLEHHAYQGVVGKDADLPLDFEVQFIKGNPLMKLFFLFMYPAMYVIRGAAKQKPPTTWELTNVLFTIATDILIYQVCGLRGLLYLVLSLWCGYSLHPGAAHFIQEHFTFNDGQETYSYYGPLNKVFINVGYHVEHHDFTKVPWTRLPKIREMASEFYDSINYHTSWLKVQWDFVMNPQLGPQSRLGRTIEDHRKGRHMPVEFLEKAKRQLEEEPVVDQEQ